MGGAERVLLRMIERLPRKRFSPRLITFKIDENCGFRELKEGWHLEAALWTFHHPGVAAARVAFTLIACNVAQVARTQPGQRLQARGIRRLRRELNRRFGSVPVIVFAAGAFAILHIEELVSLLGGPPPQFSFRPAQAQAPPLS